jgi:NADH-quinone oxidoreductase subunit H
MIFLKNWIFFEYLCRFLLIIIPLLLSVAYLTLVERKIMGAIQRRKGPNVVGLFGLLQPLADGLKLFVKETILPRDANIRLFVFAPVLTFFLSLISWVVIPFSENGSYTDLNLGILYLFAISSLGVYGIIISGWSSNSKYAFLGALRSAAQMVSYEVSIGFVLITVILCAKSMNLATIVEAQKGMWFCFTLFPAFIMFFVSILAETNRHPFDLPEAEAELVAGYNVEYSAMGFALFFLGEYSNMILMSSFCSILFLGGWLPPFGLTIFPGIFWFSLKIIFFLILFIWIRAAFPRYRYDQLMKLGWKVYLPLSVSCVLMTAAILMTFFDFNLLIHMVDFNQTNYYLVKSEEAENLMKMFDRPPNVFKSGTLPEYRLPIIPNDIEILVDFGNTGFEEIIFYVPEGMELYIPDDESGNVEIREVFVY